MATAWRLTPWVVPAWKRNVGCRGPCQLVLRRHGHRFMQSMLHTFLYSMIRVVTAEQELSTVRSQEC